MPETGKQTIKARTSSHSDVAATPAAKAYQSAQTERQFGDALIRQLRQVNAPVRVGTVLEEWISTTDGLVHELSADVEATAE
jgi:hypothetical protein